MKGLGTFMQSISFGDCQMQQHRCHLCIRSVLNSRLMEAEKADWDTVCISTVSYTSFLSEVTAREEILPVQSGLAQVILHF